MHLPGIRIRHLACCALAALFTTAASAQQNLHLVGGCGAQTLAQCDYASPNHFTPGVTDVYLEDGSRANHPVPIRVRYPIGATGARPVVIWSHGGGTTTVDQSASNIAGFTVSHGQQGSVRRSESFARAGFVVIHIGRMEPRDLSGSQLQDCADAGVILGGIINPDASALSACRTWTGWHRYGPLNVAFVVDMLQYYRVGMLPGFEGTLDRNRIAVGGWSGGTESVLNIAGAYQRWDGAIPGGGAVTQAPTAVPGVIAFFADAPRGPAWAGYGSGFQEDSPYGIDGRPLLMNTARDDRGPDGGPVVSRNHSFFGAARGGKLMSYSSSPAADGGPNHGTMDINDEADASGCNTALREQHCGWLESLGVAYLDAAVLGRTDAINWLASDNLKLLSGGLIELYIR